MVQTWKEELRDGGRVNTGGWSVSVATRNNILAQGGSCSRRKSMAMPRHGANDTQSDHTHNLRHADACTGMGIRYINRHTQKHTQTCTVYRLIHGSTLTTHTCILSSCAAEMLEQDRKEEREQKQNQREK